MTPPPPPPEDMIIIPNECQMDSSCYCDEYSWLFDEGFFPFQRNGECNTCFF